MPHATLPGYPSTPNGQNASESKTLEKVGLAAGAQIYATGRLRRRILEIEGEAHCRSEIVCMADDVLVLRGPEGGQPRGSATGRSWSALTSQVTELGSSA